jgi:hypothetical protein
MASSLDLAALRAKLSELSNKTKVSDILWKPQEGTNQIRIVPLKGHPENPFIEAHFHYLGGKTYLSPLTYGEPDPIEEFCQSLRGEGGLSKEDWAQTKKFAPKLRTFVPIVVRTQESEGVRFWGFGKTTYQELLSYIADPEYGDIIDPILGRDIKVNFTPAEKSPTTFPQTGIMISPKQTALSADKDLIKKLLEVQPDIFDVYKRMSYDDLKAVLDKFLSPTAAPTLAEVIPGASDWDAPATAVKTPAVSAIAEASTKVAARTPKDVDAEFEKLFNS